MPPRSPSNNSQSTLQNVSNGMQIVTPDLRLMQIVCFPGPELVMMGNGLTYSNGPGPVDTSSFVRRDVSAFRSWVAAQYTLGSLSAGARRESFVGFYTENGRRSQPFVILRHWRGFAAQANVTYQQGRTLLGEHVSSVAQLANNVRRDPRSVARWIGETAGRVARTMARFDGQVFARVAFGAVRNIASFLIGGMDFGFTQSTLAAQPLPTSSTGVLASYNWFEGYGGVGGPDSNDTIVTYVRGFYEDFVFTGDLLVAEIAHYYQNRYAHVSRQLLPGSLASEALAAIREEAAERRRNNAPRAPSARSENLFDFADYWGFDPTRIYTNPVTNEVWRGELIRKFDVPDLRASWFAQAYGDLANTRNASDALRDILRR